MSRIAFLLLFIAFLRPAPAQATEDSLNTLRKSADKAAADWELQFMVAGCAERKIPLEIVGSGSKRGVGRPIDAAMTVTTSAIRGITL